jgi:hypothetical protein
LPEEGGKGTAPSSPAPSKSSDSVVDPKPAPLSLIRPLAPRPRQAKVWVEFSLRELEEEFHRVRCGKRIALPRDSEGWGLVGLAGGGGIAPGTGWGVLAWITLFVLGVVTVTGLLSGVFILVTANRSRDDSAQWAEIVERDLMMILGRTEPSFVTEKQQMKLNTPEVRATDSSPITQQG